VVSGVGAANIALRDLHKPEYDTRKFNKQYIHFVDQPYRQPRYQSSDSLSEQNAFLAAAQCQGCEEPACVVGCPAGIDIPGFLRRMEVKNYAGAARLIREKNLFGEVCGVTCAVNPPCQRDCYRRSFAGEPVRIAELQRWVCAQAGEAGWLKPQKNIQDFNIAVIGGGPAALSCASYLALAGYFVDVFAPENRPGGKIWPDSIIGVRLNAAVERDVEGILRSGIHFYPGSRPDSNMNLDEMMHLYKVIYLAEGESAPLAKLAGHPGVFRGKEFLMNGVSVVEAVASGRQAAIAIQQYLTSRL
jgi:NADPH-dependent glutamate synthase beta subunit-like oxidoreductase